jgi:hypothetical protein
MFLRDIKPDIALGCQSKTVVSIRCVKTVYPIENAFMKRALRHKPRLDVSALAMPRSKRSVLGICNLACWPISRVFQPPN